MTIALPHSEPVTEQLLMGVFRSWLELDHRERVVGKRTIISQLTLAYYRTGDGFPLQQEHQARNYDIFQRHDR
jgi:hypothetical protein